MVAVAATRANPAGTTTCGAAVIEVEVVELEEVEEVELDVVDVVEVVEAAVVMTEVGVDANSCPSPDAQPASASTATASAPSHLTVRSLELDVRLRIVSGVDPDTAAPSTCTSCGAEVTDLHRVHRKYVTAAAWDQEPSERVLDEIESWCFACLTHYPHEPA